MERFSFEILGQKLDITIKDGEKSDLIKIIKHYKDKANAIMESYPYKSSVEVALLAGIKITEELYALYQRKAPLLPETSKEIDQKLTDSIKELENTLEL